MRYIIFFLLCLFIGTPLSCTHTGNPPDWSVTEKYQSEMRLATKISLHIYLKNHPSVRAVLVVLVPILQEQVKTAQITNIDSIPVIFNLIVTNLTLEQKDIATEIADIVIDVTNEYLPRIGVTDPEEIRISLLMVLSWIQPLNGN